MNCNVSVNLHHVIHSAELQEIPRK